MMKNWTTLLAAAALAAPVLAQSDSAIGLDGRVQRLEKELRAVQRKVFPGGAGDTIQPDIQPEAAPPSSAGTPATSPIEDMTARVDSVERSLAQITGQVEQNGYKQRQLDEQFAKLKADYDYRLSAIEKGGAPAPAAASASGSDDAPPPRTSGPSTTAKTPPPLAQSGDGASTPPPATGDPAEDAYMAGFRLWSAKRYPDAEAALKSTVAKYPDSKRASYAQNLLGRAYLDEGKPGLAADAFYTNYKKMPRGERAPDSLYYLGQSLMRLKKPADACKVYSEFDDVYGAKAIDSLKAKIVQAKTDAKCGG